MKLIWSIKRFIIYLSYALSKSFLYSQAPFQNILKNIFFSKIYCLKNTFKTITNNIEISEIAVKKIENDLTMKSIYRSQSKTSKLSKSIKFEEIPIFIKNILKENKKKLEYSI